jgi:peptidoglycan hydrolase-like protein with peptidoglycan-binding domain
LIIQQARKWLGLKKSDGSYQIILDTYNNHKPLARGYKVQRSDAWCATFASACAIAVGNTSVPLECSCKNQVDGWKKAGRWAEDDAYIPSPDDYIYYDWDDSGKGDNTGWPDHVGIVETCDGKTITVIEGNKGGKVARRTLEVNAKYIRGYGIPVKDKALISKGDTGKLVRVWQVICGTTPDGDFGEQTKKKTKSFQKKHKLAQTGSVDKVTWEAGLKSVMPE